VKLDKSKLFALFVVTLPVFEFEVFLINKSEKVYDKIKMTSGAWTTIDEDAETAEEGMMKTGEFTKDFRLDKNSQIRIDKSDLGELDFMVWYKLEFFGKSEADNLKVRFYLPKAGFRSESNRMFIPELSREGYVIELEEDS
jgi:hypothetical protein